MIHDIAVVDSVFWALLLALVPIAMVCFWRSKGLDNDDDEPARVLRRAIAAMPAQMLEVRVGRMLAVHSRPADAGKPLLCFVHGSCASMVQWCAQLDHFHALGYPIVAYDMYGCGRSPKPRGWGCYAIAEHEVDLAALLAMFAPAGGVPPILVAHSVGCSLALTLAGRGSLSIAGVCLLAPKWRAMPLPIFWLPTSWLDGLQPALSAAFYQSALHATTRAQATPAHAEVCQLAVAINRGNPMHMCKAYYRQLRAVPLELVRSLTLRSLILSGDGDGIVPSREARELLALLPEGSELHVVPRTAHQLMQENPVVVSAHLQRYAETCSGLHTKGC